MSKEISRKLTKDAYMLRGLAHDRTNDATKSVWDPLELAMINVSKKITELEIRHPRLMKILHRRTDFEDN